MLKDLVGKTCKIVLESVSTFCMHSNAGIGGSEFMVIGADVLEIAENFIKVRVLDKATFKNEYRRVVLWEENEETYLNIKNIVSITAL